MELPGEDRGGDPSPDRECERERLTLCLCMAQISTAVKQVFIDEILTN